MNLKWPVSFSSKGMFGFLYKNEFFNGDILQNSLVPFLVTSKLK